MDDVSAATISGPTAPGVRAATGAAGWPVLGEARFSGIVAELAWPLARVRQLLPPPVEPGPLADGDVHPVLLLYGVQAGGTTHLAGLRIPLGCDYRELALAVPGVRCGDAGAPATFVARMWADYFPVVWNGRERYGFSKALAELRWAGASFVVAGPDGAVVCRATSEPRGDFAPAASVAGLAPIATWLTDVLVGRTAGGRLVRTPSEWETTTARARPGQVAFEVGAPLLHGCPAGTQPGPARAAFEVRDVRWTLGWPEAGARPTS